MTEDTTTKFPADGAIERALELAGASAHAAAAVRAHPHLYSTTLAFARYIEQHESPPVDPVLLKARELAAGVAHEIEGYSDASDFAAGYRSGTYDNDPEVVAIVEALRAAAGELM